VLDFENALYQFGFTSYESKLFQSILKYEMMDASNLAKMSSVPQAKVYETLSKLENRGLIEPIPLGSKHYYRSKPKSVIKEYFDGEFNKIQNNRKIIENSVDEFYHSENSPEIPFVGVAGMDNIENNLIELIEQSKSELIAFFPPKMYTPKVIDALNKSKLKINLKLIFPNEEIAQPFLPLLPNVNIFRLQTPAFDILRSIYTQIISILPSDAKESHAQSIISNLIHNLKDIFGLMMVDSKKSFFLIPIPISISMAIIATLPELIDFHKEGLTLILESSILI
jgi:sugar-specific transcriptional regulator TrmB